jgi:hypothetical protein
MFDVEAVVGLRERRVASREVSRLIERRRQTGEAVDLARRERDGEDD